MRPSLWRGPEIFGQSCLRVHLTFDRLSHFLQLYANTDLSPPLLWRECLYGHAQAETLLLPSYNIEKERLNVTSKPTY